MAIGTPVVGAVGEGFTQNLTIPAPATINDGDVLVISAFMENDPNDNFTVSGFTLDNQIWHTTGGDVSVGVFYKVASSEAGNYTLSIDGGASRYLIGFCVAWPGVDNSTPMDTSSVTNTSNDNTNHTASAITTVTDGAVVGLAIGAVQAESTGASPPTGYTEDAEHAEEGGVNQDAVLSVASKTVATAGLETPGAYTGYGGNADIASITYALRPAGAGGANNAIPLLHHLRHHGR